MACVAPPEIPVLRQERPAAVPEARRPGLTIQERRGVPELSYIGFPVSHTKDYRSDIRRYSCQDVQQDILCL